MFSYFPNGIGDVAPEFTIDLGILQTLIRSHPKRSKVEELRRLTYKSEQYDKLKLSLPYITPHGVFSDNRGAEFLKKFSGILYFDVDGILNLDINIYKQQIIDRYKKYIFMIGKSVGGKGLFFYIKFKSTKKLSTGNFLKIYNYYRTEVFKELKIDNNAKGISRAQFIPFDEELYINNNAQIDIPIHLLNNNSPVHNCAEQDNKTTGLDVLSYPAHSIKYIDINEILKILKTTTYVDVGEQDFIIKPVEFMKLYIPPSIPVGKRHIRYRAMINAIIHNNPEFTLLEVLSFINYINYNISVEPLREKEMINTVSAHYNKIKNEGLKNVYVKNVHTNKRLQGDLRRKISNREIGKLQIEKSIELIRITVDGILELGEKPTIKKVSDILKGYRSERTVKKYWRRVVPKTAGFLKDEPILSQDGKVLNDAENAKNASDI